MDPITLATAAVSLAEGCYNVSQVIYTTFKRCQEIDEDLAALHTDLHELAKVLNIFNQTVLHYGTKQDSQEIVDADHLQKIKSSLDELAKTLKLLGKILESIKRSDNFGPLRNPVMLAKLELKSGDIQKIKQNIAIYTRTIQLSISFIT